VTIRGSRPKYLRCDQSGCGAIDAVLKQLAPLLVRVRIKPEALPRRRDIGCRGGDVIKAKVEQSRSGGQAVFSMSHGDASLSSVNEIVTNARNTLISDPSLILTFETGG
jgi:hypothetical protein